MSIVGQRERMTQNRVVALLQSMGYHYLGDWNHRPYNTNVEEDLLLAYLVSAGYEEALARRAIRNLLLSAGDQSNGLYYVNKEVYTLLRYGIRVQPAAGEPVVTVWPINWQDPGANHFAIAEEVTVRGEHSKRPDIVLYINGIAVGVLELKRSITSVSEGIHQNLQNQHKDFIQHFFTTMQFVMAGNDTEGLHYGTIETGAKYYLTWKENHHAEVANRLDRDLLNFCEPARLLEVMRDFIVFDGGVKKLCRHNQYFGVKAAQPFAQRHEGGIIWHTQGSGKSLTMVWLARWLRENMTNARVLIVTDRVELDEQIQGGFRGVNETIYRTRSGADLIDRLNKSEEWLICSLIHKFSGPENASVDNYLEELRRSLPPGFKAKGDLFVFVDECHRTQSGELHRAMRAIIPDATFIGFTGTPLLRADKQRSIEIFGRYIHTYKFNEAVADHVVLDLRYEARDIDQHLGSQERIDQWFDSNTRGLTDIARAQIKQRWGTMQKLLSSRDRLEKIVADILMDMETRDRLRSRRGNAMLVCDSIYQACRVYQMFIDQGFTQCAIITSYTPTPASIAGEMTGEGETEKLVQYQVYMDMLNGQSIENFERDVKKKFIEDPGQMRLLIVVDRLLTGFDAPPATYLYLDKPMRDHGLFQAICRVNRLDGDDKTYGYVIDYKDLFHSLEAAVTDYTSGALDGYEPEDVAGLLEDRLGKARERLAEALEVVRALCEPVLPPKSTEMYIQYFCGNNISDPNALKETEQRRVALYKHVVSLLRAYADIANEMPEAGYTMAESEQIRLNVEYFEKVRTEIKMASGDYVDMKMYEPAMRHLLDAYVRAEDSRKLSAFDDLSLIQLIVERGAAALEHLPEGIHGSQTATAETIENNLRRLILDEQPMNPIYYDRMSELLNALILERRSQAINYEQYLQRIIALTQQVANHAGGTSYPEQLNTRARRAFYDNLGQYEYRAVELDEAIQRVLQDDWRSNRVKRMRVWNAIFDCLQNEDLTNQAFELAVNQTEY